MAIGTYAELQTAAASWLVRGDLTARIPEFITLAESRLNRVLRGRRAESDVALTASVGVRTIALPATYSEALNCWLTVPGSVDRQELRFVDPALLTVHTDVSRPYAWTIDGTNLAFERPSDAAYAITLRCLLKFALSTTATTNWLLTDYPDAYLYATLCEASPMLRDAEMSNSWEQRLSRAISEINAKAARSRSQSTLSTEIGQLQRVSRSGAFDIRTGL